MIELKTPYGEVGPLEQRVHEVLIDHNGPIARDRLQPLFPRLVRRPSSRTSCAASTATATAGRRRAHGARAAQELTRRLEHVAIARPHFLALGLDMLPSEPRRRHIAPRACRSSPGRCAAPAEWDEVSDALRQPDLRGLRGVMALKAEVSVHRRIAEIGRDGLGRLRRRARLSGQPVRRLRLPRHRRGVRLRGRRAPAGRRSTWRCADEAGAVAAVTPLYLKSPQPGRIRLRPQLGRRLRAGRRALLSEAGRRLAVLAGDRAAPAGARGRRPRRGRGGCCSPAR